MGPPALFATASGVAPSRDSAFDPQLTGGATSLEQSAQREVTRLHEVGGGRLSIRRVGPAVNRVARLNDHSDLSHDIGLAIGFASLSVPKRNFQRLAGSP